ARELVSRKPDTFRMDWSSAHTLWPGRVTLGDVRMQGQVRRTQWRAQAGQVRGRVALWPLLRREVRVPWLEAEAVTGAVVRADAELPRPPPRPATHAAGWTLRMDRIASDSVAGGEVFGWQVAGAGRAEVGFSKQFRGGPLELFASTAHFENASVERDGKQWLGDARIDADFSLPPHLSSDHAGLDK